MFITYHDALCNTSSGFIEKEILKNQVQLTNDIKKSCKKIHEMIFTQERMRRIRLTKKLIQKITQRKGERNSLLEDHRTPHTEHYYR